MATKWKSIIRQIILWAAVAAIMATTALSLREVTRVITIQNGFEEKNGLYLYGVDDDVLKNQDFKESMTYQRLGEHYVNYHMRNVLQEYKESTKIGHYYSQRDIEVLSKATVFGEIHYSKKSGKKPQKFEYNKGKYESTEGTPGRVYVEAQIKKSEGAEWDEKLQKDVSYQEYFLATECYQDGDAVAGRQMRDNDFILSATNEKNYRPSDMESLTMTIIMDPQVVQEVADNYAIWNRTIKSDINKGELYAVIMAVSVLLLLICATSKDSSRLGKWMDRMYLEIHWCIFFLFFGCSVGAAVLVASGSDEGIADNFIQMGYAAMLIFEFVGLYMIISGIRKLKDRYYFRSSIVYKLIAGTGHAIKNQTKQWNELRGKEASTLRVREKELKRKRHTLIFFAMGIVALAFFFLCLLGMDGAFFFIGVIFVAPAIWLFLRLLKDYRMSIQDMLDFEKVLLQIDEIAGGDLDAKTDIGEESLYYAATKNLEGIGQGLENSMKEQLKSERMKVDLITNVSHDLKTPLTSIIGYIDLLSKDETLSEESRDYVTILEKKSERLRNIVTDLFDLAKTTSGNVDVNLSSIDFRRLVQQTLAEMGDTIEESGFAVIEKYDAEPTIIKADADRMYRVIQNVMDNAIKYSLSGSRIYVSLKDVGEDEICLEVINTASYQMDFDEIEITERFRRGDEARSTEGSGLGLSIADSFTTLSGGRLEVHTSGDQFMVEITFRKI